MQSPKDHFGDVMEDVTWVKSHDSGVVWTDSEDQVDDQTTTVKCPNEKKVITAKTSEILLKDPDGSVRGREHLSMHQPGAIETLSSRWRNKQIYTYVDGILVAANPFQRMPNLYNVERLEEYRKGKQSPHPYAVADRAYRLMLSEGRSQLINVGGISGSGKTRVAEWSIRYLEYVGGKAISEGRDVENKLLQHNITLQAFGSAKTITNDNSSRFGKFVEVQFDHKGKISGAFIRTYLLETSRVCHISDQERNFDCFYMLSAAPPEEIERYELAKFHYLNQSNCFEIEGVVDSESYDNLIKAMGTAGISSKEQNEIFRIVAAILHLGNVEFAAGNDEFPLKIKDEKSRFHLTTTSNLLMCEEKELEHSLCVTSEDRAVKYLDLNAANERRDELAKILYSRLFDWLVNKINSSMGQDPESKCFIGVHEEIVWNYNGFTDNQEVIDLAEKVTNQTQFLLDNNKVSLVTEQHILLGASKCSTVAELFPHLSSKSSNSLSVLSVDSTVKSQSQSLLDAISATGAHYIQCVKPNSESTAGPFDNEYVLLQLRYGLTSLNNEVQTLQRDSEISKTNLNKAKEDKLLFEENRTLDEAKERLPSLLDKEQKHQSEREHSASNFTKNCDGIIDQARSNHLAVDMPQESTELEHINNNNIRDDQEALEDKDSTDLDPKDKGLFNFLKAVSDKAMVCLLSFNVACFALAYSNSNDLQIITIAAGTAVYFIFSLVTLGSVSSLKGRAKDIDFATIMVLAQLAYVFAALCLACIFLANGPWFIVFPFFLVWFFLVCWLVWRFRRPTRPYTWLTMLKKKISKSHQQ